jgi:hypothetical protein
MLLFLPVTLGSRPTQPPTMWVPGAVSLDVKLTIVYYLMLNPDYTEIFLHTPSTCLFHSAQAEDNFTFTVSSMY